MKYILMSLLTAIFLPVIGCTVGPDYTSPAPDTTDSWHTRLDKGLSAEQADPNSLSDWWNNFNDDILTSLIERAINQNLDIKDALARLKQARIARGLAETDKFPTLDLSASANWSRNGTSPTTELYSTAFDAGWEIDIFGGINRSIEAATAELEASSENLNDVLVSLSSEIAISYVELRIYQTQLGIIEQNLESQTETYQLVQWEYEAGLSDELAGQQARYNLESTRSEIPGTKTSINEAMNRIAVLLGEKPGSIHNELEKPLPVPVASPEIAIGVPADILRRRPDIRMAERELAAQTAQVGVATADLYPKLSLHGSIGIQASNLSRLSSNITTTDSWVLSGGPQISWAIFDAGAIRKNIEIQSTLQEQALINYENTVLLALEEIENALTAYINEQNRIVNLKKAAEAAEKADVLAKYNYSAGLSDFNDVLESQRSLLSFQNQVAQSNGTITSNLIRLYKALGGGWNSSTAEKRIARYYQEK